MTVSPPPIEPRDRILAAAEAEFADKGFAGARVASIAARAGVNKAMLYYYFGNKEALYDAVLTRTAEQIVGVAMAAFGESSASMELRVESFLRGYRKIILDRPQFVRMLTRDMLDGGETIVRLMAPRIRPLIDRYLLSEGPGAVRHALNPDVDMRFVLLTLIAPYILFTSVRPLLAALFGVDPDSVRSAFERTAEAVTLHGLLARPAQEKTP